MDIFIAWDGDHIGREVGRASLADDVEGLRRISQGIDLGNQIWKSWVESHGGSLISMGGDEGRAIVPADYLDELPKIRTQYAECVGSPVSVGVGTKLSEADRALIAAKLQGGDRVVFFTDEVNEMVEEARKKGEKTEEAKIADEYLSKAGRVVGWHDGAPALSSLRHEHETTFKPSPPSAPDLGQVHGEPSATSLIDEAKSNKSPPPIPHDAKPKAPAPPNSFGHDHPGFGPHGKTVMNALQMHLLDHDELGKSAPAMNDGAFTGATRPSAATVDKPVPTQGEHSEGQVAMDAFEQSGGAPAPEMTHAAADFEEQLHAHAADQERSDTHQAIQSTKNIQDVKQRVAQALMMLKQQGQMLEQMKQAAPDAYAAVTGLAQAVVGLARELQGGQPLQKSVEKASDAGVDVGGDKWVTTCDEHNTMVGSKTKKLAHAAHKDTASFCDDCRNKVPVKKEELKTEADPAEDVKSGDELEKAKLPMPKAAAHHHVVLPVGSQNDGKIKVSHSDGTSSWKQMRSGMIRSQDPSGHPTSSRNPGGK